MQSPREDVYETLVPAADLPSSWRGLSHGSRMIAGGAAVGLALAGVASTRPFPARAQDASPVSGGATPVRGTAAPFKSDVDVLNYALTLEHLEATFYREGLKQFAEQAFVDGGFQASVRQYIDEIGKHEAAHVKTLTQVISKLGGKPVKEGKYNFGYSDLPGFLQVAAALENTGVAAYGGAAQYLKDNGDLLTAALTIHGVEARHAAYLNVLTGSSPFPDAVNAAQTPEQVLTTASQFIVSGEASPTATPTG